MEVSFANHFFHLPNIWISEKLVSMEVLFDTLRITIHIRNISEKLVSMEGYCICLPLGVLANLLFQKN